MATKKVRFMEVYPAQQQERQFLVDLDDLVISAPDESSGGGNGVAPTPTTTFQPHNHLEIEERVWFLMQ